MCRFEQLSREELLTVVQAQVRQIQALRAQNADLRGRLARVERLLSRNSGNSSLPPSTDDLPGKTQPKPKPAKKTGRGRGKQHGAPGRALPWVDPPDERVPHRPEGKCDCGADLAGAAEVGIVRSHQVHDLPEVRIRVWQHDVYRVRCRCGAEHDGSVPAEVSAAPSSYGVHLQSLAVYLLVYQHVPVQRCVRLIADLTGGVGPSEGFVHGMLTRCARAVTEVVAAIKTLITLAYVVGFDETTLRCGAAGAKKYVLSASTEQAVVYHLGGRDLDSFAAFGILPEFAGVAVHDRYGNYFHSRWATLAGHQACCAHLVRDFADAGEVYPEALWPAQARRCLRGLIRAWHTAGEDGLAEIGEEVRVRLVREFRHAIRVGLAQVPRAPGPRYCTAQPAGRDLLEFCRDHEDDVLRFCFDTRVWPTNNISERDLRPTKTQQKISGRLTSDEVTQDRLDIRSYLDTARKHGADVMTVLRAALTGNPWRPPIRAPA